MKKNYWRYIVTGLIALGFYYYLQIDKKATVLLEDNEYPNIAKNSKNYQGLITRRALSGAYKGCYLFDMSNGQKFSTSDLTHLKVGDSIHRPSNMDSIYIYRNGNLSRVFLYRKHK